MTVDYHTADASTLLDLGFRLWDDEGGLYLCPLTRFTDLPDGIALHAISGAVKVKGRDYIDDDTRGGLLAYGIIPGKTRTEKTAAAVAADEAVRRAEFRKIIAEAAAENGVFDMSSGQMLHGQAAVDALPGSKAGEA